MAQSPTIGRPLDTTRPYVTYEQFRNDPCIERGEWVAGEVIPMATASELHSLIVTWLIKVLAVIIDDDLGLGHVHADPFNQKLPGLPGRSPDVLLVLHEHHDRVRENYLDGPADLVVEVLSPSTAGVDRGEKSREYAAGGVPEYWIVDPQSRAAEFYRLDVDGRYQRASADGDGRYACASVPGFWIREEWIWSRPPVRDVETSLGLR